MNFKEAEQRLILKCIAGSHSYGTNIETSDIDIRGIFIAPKEYYLGFSRNVEQVSSKEPNDTVYYELKKYMQLAANANPNILENLFCRDKDILFITKQGELLRANREKFLSKKCMHTYSGYAFAQLKRIKTHRKWLLNPPKKKPERTDFGLPEGKSLIPKDWIKALSLSDYEKEDNTNASEYSEIIDIARKEKSFYDALENWKQYINWKETRNKDRAALEAKYFFDTKHCAHCVRLVNSGIEILEGKGIDVYRDDSQFLIDIRAGKFSYEEMMDYVDKKMIELESAYSISTLPYSVNQEELNNLCVQLVESHLA